MRLQIKVGRKLFVIKQKVISNFHGVDNALTGKAYQYVVLSIDNETVLTQKGELDGMKRGRVMETR